jgi:hypothetical protein
MTVVEDSINRMYRRPARRPRNHLMVLVGVIRALPRCSRQSVSAIPVFVMPDSWRLNVMGFQMISVSRNKRLPDPPLGK